jgi:hypothetical protein
MTGEKSDETSGVISVAITPDMLAAGAKACGWVDDLEGGLDQCNRIAEDVFRAMVAASPVVVVSAKLVVLDTY